jgi:hypothetical protein
MLACAAELAIIFLLAVIPALCALLQGLAVVPRRRQNITWLVESTLARGPGRRDRESEEGRTAESPQESGMAPQGTHYLTARGGTERIRKDFGSLYGSSFFAAAAIVTLLYFLFFWLGLSLLSLSSSGCFFPGKSIIGCLGGSEALTNMAYAALGAYIFNLGVMVRRAFLSDITEHVFWSANYRLLLSSGLALILPTVSVWHPPYLLFAIAFTPRTLVTALKNLVRVTAEKFGNLRAHDTTDELSLSLIQGIDIWKEQRLEEEGIESVQNLATADVLTLAVKTHYSMRTLLDWVDQAILINRLPGKLTVIRNAGLPISAIEFAWMSPVNSLNEEMANLVAKTIENEPPVVAAMMNSLYEDAYVNALWSLWQADPSRREPTTG